jgi:hypothetical protein
MTSICYIQDIVAQDIWCSECAFYCGYSECDECGNSVCGDIKCTTNYPHKNNSVWIICKSCSNRVLEKLKPYNYYEKENEIMTLDEVNAIIALMILGDISI